MIYDDVLKVKVVPARKRRLNRSLSPLSISYKIESIHSSSAFGFSFKSFTRSFSLTTPEISMGDNSHQNTRDFHESLPQSSIGHLQSKYLHLISKLSGCDSARVGELPSSPSGLLILTVVALSNVENRESGTLLSCFSMRENEGSESHL